MHTYEDSLAFAQKMDAEDSLRRFRKAFLFPTVDGKPSTYLCGHSLGLQPINVRFNINEELDSWAELGVDGHFRGDKSWFSYHKHLLPPVARLLGAKEEEVIVMNSLTVNLHLLLVSFYRPTASRYKILIEEGAFPSDLYAVQSQAQFHGFNPEEAVVELKPREGERLLRTEDILATIDELGDELALVMVGGVNYLTGQLYDVPTITKKGHEVGAKVGFDLAHAAGNVILKMHEWGPDFGVFCSYKYLNSGPGSVGGAFVHQRHLTDGNITRFHGWWGVKEEERFAMHSTFNPFNSAEAWQLSNAPVFAMAAFHASLDLFDEAGMEALANKSKLLTGYLEYLLLKNNREQLEIVTPNDEGQRGSQLSLLIPGSGPEMVERFRKEGIIVDWRRYGEKDGLLRVAPASLYNTFEEVYRFSKVLQDILA